MNKEVSDALHMLLHCALKDKEFETQKEQFEIVYEHIEKLQEKINTYEEPEDLTLMFMYCEEKTKDKIKELHERIDKAIEYINKNSIYFATKEKVSNYFSNCNCDDLLEILKGDVK